VTKSSSACPRLLARVRHPRIKSVPAKFISGDLYSGKRSSLTSISPVLGETPCSSTAGLTHLWRLLCRGTIYMRYEKGDSKHSKVGFVNKPSRSTRKALIFIPLCVLRSICRARFVGILLECYRQRTIGTSVLVDLNAIKSVQNLVLSIPT
jgi:hypothetical protein